MGRKKQITEEELIQCINDFLYNCCDGDQSKLKIPAIGNYLRENGYPALQDYLIRRNEAASSYLKKLKEEGCKEELRVVAIYKTLDVEKFLDTHSSKVSLKKGLMDLDQYYKSVAMSAATINNRYDAMKKEEKQRDTELKKTIASKKELQEHVESLEHRNKELTGMNQALKSIVDNYVYPEIANELLQKSGLIQQTEGYIKNNVLDQQLVKADTVIKSNSNIIQGMFQRVEE